MNCHPLKSAFQPEELKFLKAIFNEITSKPWFPNSSDARQSFAKFLFDTFLRANFNTQEHLATVEAIARKFDRFGDTE
jgi:hypothetical protein